ASRSETVHRGVRGHVQPGFAIDSAQGLAHDIAILELADDVVDIVPAQLPPATDAGSQLAPGSPVLLVGYGATDDAASNAGVKNTGVAAIVQITADGILIGSASGVRNCTGDSGGPSIANTSPSGYWLLGVTSRSALADAPCAEGAIHTRVDAHLPWIDQVL